MKHWLERTELLLGKDGLEKLQKAHVLIVGLGGVGSYATEAIARAGIGEMTIIDGDVVDITNVNRQLQALQTTVAQGKAELIENRLLQINPTLKLNVIKEFQGPDELKILLSNKFDYVIDAIDSISPKIYLLKTAYESGNRIIGCMGAGGKMDPLQIKIADISKTKICPLAQAMRKRLKYLGIKKGIKVVYSEELPDRGSIMRTDGTNYKKSAYGTISYLPAMFGMTCASVVIREICEWKPVKPHENSRKK